MYKILQAVAYSKMGKWERTVLSAGLVGVSTHFAVINDSAHF